MTKRVVVQMSDDCHKALKQYAAFYDMSMGDVMYNCTRMQFHKQMQYCDFVQGLLGRLGIFMDKRVKKPCFSFMCFNCKHLTACRTGLYKGVVEFRQDILDKRLLNEDGMRILRELQLASGQDPQFPPQQPTPEEVSEKFP